MRWDGLTSRPERARTHRQVRPTTTNAECLQCMWPVSSRTLGRLAHDCASPFLESSDEHASPQHRALSDRQEPLGPHRISSVKCGCWATDRQRNAVSSVPRRFLYEHYSAWPLTGCAASKSFSYIAGSRRAAASGTFAPWGVIGVSSAPWDRSALASVDRLGAWLSDHMYAQAAPLTSRTYSSLMSAALMISALLRVSSSRRLAISSGD